MKNLQAFMQGGHETVSTHINLKFLAKLTQKNYYFKFNYFLCCFFFFLKIHQPQYSITIIIKYYFLSFTFLIPNFHNHNTQLSTAYKPTTQHN